MNQNELRDFLISELSLLKQTVQKVDIELASLGSNQPSDFQKAGFGAFLMNFYSGIENILKQICRFEGISIPVGETWHIGLLKIFENKLPSGHSLFTNIEILDIIKRYRNLRHVIIHGYGIMLKWDLMIQPLKDLNIIFGKIEEEIKKYMDEL